MHFFYSHFSILIPIINLQCDQNPNHYQKYLANGAFEVFAHAVFIYECASDMPEEFNH